MAAPYDYTVNVDSPLQAAAQGVQFGAGLAEIQQKRMAQELAMQQQLRQQQFLQRFMSKSNKTADDYSQATMMIPGLREQFKQSWDMQNTAQQQNSLKEMGTVFSALKNKSPQVATGFLEQKLAALENSKAPKQEIDAVRTMVEQIKLNPDMVKDQIGIQMLAVPGGDKVFEGLSKIGVEARAEELQPVMVSKALADLQKTGWDINKIRNDIDVSRESNRIALIKSQLDRENNDLKRKELQIKLEDAANKREELIRTKSADVDSARTNIDNMLNTADRILNNPSLPDVLGSMEGRVPVVFSDEAADAVALIETLKSQAFLAQIPNIKGMGALSNAEGEKLQSALQNLNRVQSESQFRANVKEAQRLLMKGRKNVTQRYGVPESVPDTPAAAPTATDIDALLKKYGQ
jgi:hypothetical protein